VCGGPQHERPHKAHTEVEKGHNDLMSLSKPVPDLPDDLWKIVMRSPGAAAVGIVTNKLLNELSTHTLQTVYDDVVKPLLARETALQSTLCDILLLPADVVRRFPFDTRRRHGGGEYHVFDTVNVVPTILEQTGGVAGYVRRAAAKETRLARKHSAPDDLEERKKHAAATRMNSLDGAIRSAGIGQSFHDWVLAISERIGKEFDPLQATSVLQIYKSTHTLKPSVSLKDAVKAVKSIDAYHSLDAIEARRVAAIEHEAKRVASAQARCAAAAAAIDAREADRAAGVTGVVDRQCTHIRSDGTRCRNTHRRDNPVMGPSGPVCRGCVRLL